MARPRKKGLDYFPMDIDLFNDEKIFDLTHEYGPLGEAVYLRVLCLIYRQGYYYKFQSLERLASLILKSIGGRWCREKSTIMKVIPFLAECNLLSKELMQENVLTSAGIQRRYLIVAKRRSEKIEEYNLLEEAGDFDMPEDGVSAAETGDFGDKRAVWDAAMQQKHRKEESKDKKSTEASGGAATAQGIFDLFSENVGPVNGVIRRELSAWMEKMEPACVEYAILEAARSGARGAGYVYAILQRLEVEGIREASQLSRAREKKPGKLAFEAESSPYEHYFDGEELEG